MAKTTDKLNHLKPNKTIVLSKEEKAKYKEIISSLSFIEAFTSVIEDKTIDKKNVPDLAVGELHVLETISKNDGATMSHIARLEHVTLGAFITCFNRLEEKGYAVRIKDELDHRINYLYITPLAKQALKEHEEYLKNVINLTLEHVKFEELYNSLTNLSKYIEAYYDPETLNPVKKKIKKGRKLS